MKKKFTLSINQEIEDEEEIHLDIVYGVDDQRRQTVYTNSGDQYAKTTKYFFGDYEREDDFYNYTKEFVYIYAPTGLCANYEYDEEMTEEFDKIWHINPDHLGSIVLAIDSEDDTNIQEFSFNTWGVPRDPTDWTAASTTTLIANRGYTGHEHLPVFELINMNGRIYDPVLSRFLSPDPFVQLPDYRDGFNRYAYCLNNPLIYTDPDGEFIHLIIGAAIGGTINWLANGAEFTWEGLGYFGIGALAGGLSAGVGMGVTASLSGASFGAGFIGSQSAMAAISSGFTTSFLTGAAVGGVAGGLDALKDSRTFWDGAPFEKTTIFDQNLPSVPQVGENNCLPTAGEVVDKSFGGNYSQSTLRNRIAPGTDPKVDALNEVNFWNGFANETGYTFNSESFNSRSLGNILDAAQQNGRITIGLDTGGSVGHHVVLKSLTVKHIYRPSGTKIKFIYKAMSNGTSTRVFSSDLMNMFYFFR